MKEFSRIQVEIRTPAQADPDVRAFVVSLANAVQPEMYRKLRTAERRYQEATRRWKSTLARIQSDPSNAVLRWRLSRDIGIFFRALEKELGLFVTNKRQALLRDLMVTKSDLGYTLRVSERFDINDIRRSGLKWSRFRELLDIKDEDEMKRCMQLLLAGKIRTNEEIRSFHRTARRR